MLRYAMVVTGVCGMAALTANAQERTYTGDAYGPDQGQWELILGGSGSNDREFQSGSGNINIELGYYLSEDFLVGGRQTLGIFDSDGTDSVITGSTAAYLQYHFDMGAVRPFIGASLGYIYGDEVDDSFFAGPEAGLKWYVKDETFIYGRVSYDWFFEDGDDADNSFDDGRFNYVVGIGFNF